ncbi:MAG: putative phage abortive infection protein [Bacteroidota bacterium]
MNLSQLQQKLKERLALGINYGLQSFGEILLSDSLLYNDFFQLKSQYNDLNRLANQGTLAYESVEVGFNKIRLGLLTLIDRLERDDLQQEDRLPKLQNNELQHRKQNFFELMRIHSLNTANVIVRLMGSGDQPGEELTGRTAIHFIYEDVFRYSYKHPLDRKPVEIVSYSQRFFTRHYPILEVYMKTIGFILRYILEEEMEQDFFIGVLRASLSQNELKLIIYYAISKIEPDFGQLLQESDLLADISPDGLLDKAHYDLELV